MRAKWVEGLSTRLVKVLEMMEVASKDDAFRRWAEGDFDNKRGFGLKTRAELREWLGLPDHGSVVAEASAAGGEVSGAVEARGA
jgi:hypothetical protein